MSRKRRKRRSEKPRRPPRPRTPRRPAAVPRLVTPEGDPLVFVTAYYQHADMASIRRILQQADDFGLDDEPEPGPDGSLFFSWFETRPDASPVSEPLSRRILATLTLRPTTLEVETISEQRLEDCHQRLETLLGDRVRMIRTRRKSAEQVLQEEPPPDAPEPLILPPEAIAEIEERMLRQWLDESIPALGGLTPREAVKTPEGRQRLDALFDYIARDQAQREMPPGMFSPDYRKAKKMLGLE